MTGAGSGGTTVGWAPGTLGGGIDPGFGPGSGAADAVAVDGGGAPPGSTTTRVPTLTRSNRSETSSFSMPMQPEETNLPIVDEAALLETLQQKKIAGAAIDVFSVEPLPVDHPFRKLDNIVLTPHLGYVTEEGFRAHYSQMVEGIDAWFKGEPLRRLA